jgi:hypothetical protein
MAWSVAVTVPVMVVICAGGGRRAYDDQESDQRFFDSVHA